MKVVTHNRKAHTFIEYGKIQQSYVTVKFYKAKQESCLQQNIA